MSIYACLLFAKSCGGLSDEIIVVDFENNYASSIDSVYKDSEVLEVAIATMISPKETYILYETLFKYISAKLNQPVEFAKISTYSEVNDLLVEGSVDLAFICTGPYVEISEYVDLLVVPLCNNEPYYQAYVITNENSSITSFEEFKNKSFVFTDPISNTGKHYPERRVKELGSDISEFFSRTVYSYSHDISMQMVSKGLVDGASIDGLIYDYMKKSDPDRVKNIRIIEKSEKFGIPPIVVPKIISPEIKSKLRRVFLNMHNDSTGKKILMNLQIDRFEVAGDTLYDSMRKSLEAL